MRPALADHALTLDVQTVDGYEGVSVPIRVSLASSCPMSRNSGIYIAKCSEPDVSLHYDCEDPDVASTCKRLVQEGYDVPRQEFVFAVPASDVRAPALNFWVHAVQYHVICIPQVSTAMSCQVANGEPVAEARWPETGQAGVSISSLP